MNRTRSKVRLSRALGIALTPKAARHLERRPYPPGEHGRRRRTQSDYKARLLEKQRLRAQYDISEAQLRLAVARAVRSGQKTGEQDSGQQAWRHRDILASAGAGRVGPGGATSAGAWTVAGRWPAAICCPVRLRPT